jgi:hypothetical protein
VAGDPGFPDLAREGLTPWQPQALYRATWFDRDKTTMVLPTGGLDGVTGKSIYQLAMESRSQHRSQDMGRLQELCSQESRVGWVSGGAGESGAVLFAGVDTRLRSIALLLPEGKERAALWSDLERSRHGPRGRARLVPSDPAAALGALRDALVALRAARARAAAAAPAPVWASSSTRRSPPPSACWRRRRRGGRLDGHRRGGGAPFGSPVGLERRPRADRAASAWRPPPGWRSSPPATARNPTRRNWLALEATVEPARRPPRPISWPARWSARRGRTTGARRRPRCGEPMPPPPLRLRVACSPARCRFRRARGGGPASDQAIGECRRCEPCRPRGLVARPPGVAGRRHATANR